MTPQPAPLLISPPPLCDPCRRHDPPLLSATTRLPSLPGYSSLSPREPLLSPDRLRLRPRRVRRPNLSGASRPSGTRSRRDAAPSALIPLAPPLTDHRDPTACSRHCVRSPSHARASRRRNTPRVYPLASTAAAAIATGTNRRSEEPSGKSAVARGREGEGEKEGREGKGKREGAATRRPHRGRCRPGFDTSPELVAIAAAAALEPRASRPRSGPGTSTS